MEKGQEGNVKSCCYWQFPTEEVKAWNWGGTALLQEVSQDLVLENWERFHIWRTE